MARARSSDSPARGGWIGRIGRGIGKHVHSCIWTVCRRVRQSREGLSGRRRQRGLTLGKTHHRGLRRSLTHRRRPGRLLRRSHRCGRPGRRRWKPRQRPDRDGWAVRRRRRRPGRGVRRRLRRDRFVGAGVAATAVPSPGGIGGSGKARATALRRGGAARGGPCNGTPHWSHYGQAVPATPGDQS